MFTVSALLLDDAHLKCVVTEVVVFAFRYLCYQGLYVQGGPQK